MSPHPGEEPLSWIFAIVPLSVAALILAFVLWRLVPERIALWRFQREAPDWRALREDPELERMIEALYVKRRELRTGPSPSEQRREELLTQADELIGQATALAVEIVRAPEGHDTSGARAALEVMAARVRVLGGEEEAES
jgi:hypothetical protein